MQSSLLTLTLVWVFMLSVIHRLMALPASSTSCHITIMCHEKGYMIPAELANHNWFIVQSDVTGSYGLPTLQESSQNIYPFS